MRSLLKRRSMVSLILASAVVAAACSEGSDPSADASPTAKPSESADAGAGLPPVPWSKASKIAAAVEGEFEKQTIASQDGNEMTISQEWVTFDLPAKFIDRRLALDPTTGAPPGATRETPHLRFMYRSKRTLMWNPNTTCGTPWIEMTAADIEQATGVRMQAPSRSDIEPLTLIRGTEPSGNPISNDADGTVYEIDVPGYTGLTMSSSLAENPGVVEELARQDQTARVRLPREEGPLEIEVDITEMAEVARAEMPDAPQAEMPPGGRVVVTWSLSASEITPDPLPAKIASSDCLN